MENESINISSKYEDIRIRIANIEDAGALLEIYAPYVEKTAISFEYDVPSLDEFKRRMRATLEKYPFLVAEADGELLGYANTKAFVGRAAYGWSVETTIYIKENSKRCGVGKRLYDALERISRLQNITNMNACIGYNDIDDEYLTKNSVEFHAHIGFYMVGRFHKSGYKFGRWYDMVWMEKIIGTHTEDQPPVIAFPDLDKEKLESALKV